MNLTLFTIPMSNCVLNIHKPQIMRLFNRNITYHTTFNMTKSAPNLQSQCHVLLKLAQSPNPNLETSLLLLLPQPT